MVEVTKKQFISGSAWKIIEQFSTKGITLIISILLVRILNPDDFGLIALTAVFTNLSSILIDGGFSTALIRKKEVDDYDYSSTLIISIAISTFLYLVIFLLAPMAARYYEESKLALVLRVIGLVLFIQAFSSVRTAYVNRNMQFKLLFKCNFIGTSISGAFGVAAAYLGFGVWSIVIHQLSQQLILTVLLLIELKWKLKFHFSFLRIREMLKFSVGVVLASFINYISSSLYNLIIGKKYSVEELGYFDKGSQLPTQISLYTFGAMSTVLLPTLASYQNNLDRIKLTIRKVTQMTSFLIAPMMVGLAMITRELVILLFTEKWLPIVTIMQYNCLYYLVTPFMLINIQVFFALGYSNKRVRIEIVRLLFLVAGVLIFGLWLKFSIDVLAFVCAVVAVLSAFISYLEVRSLIKYSFIECLGDIYKPLLASAIMGIFIYFLDLTILPLININSNILILVIKVIFGIIIYVLLSLILKMNEYKEIKNLISTLVKRRMIDE